MTDADAGAGPPDIFLDTNVLICLLSDDPARADVAQALLRSRGVVSIQVLNEFASVTMRKIGLRLAEVQELLTGIRHFCRVEPITLDTHELGLAYRDRYGYSICDSMILAAATLAGCRTLMSEDMQAGRTIMGGLVIHNPFVTGVRGTALAERGLDRSLVQ